MAFKKFMFEELEVLLVDLLIQPLQTDLLHYLMTLKDFGHLENMWFWYFYIYFGLVLFTIINYYIYLIFVNYIKLCYIILASI